MIYKTNIKIENKILSVQFDTEEETFYYTIKNYKKGEKIEGKTSENNSENGIGRESDKTSESKPDDKPDDKSDTDKSDKSDTDKSDLFEW